MARPKRRLDTYFAEGMLDARGTFFLVVRLAVRVNQAIPRVGAAAVGTGLWRGAMPVFVVVDLAVWLLLRRDRRFGLAWRLPLDAADVAFWCLSPFPPSGRSGFALLAAMPLAVEAGFRIGARGVIVPATVLGVAAATRSAAGRPAFIGDFGWLVIAVGMGTALWAYCRRLYEHAERDHSRLLAAERRRAFLGGQNAVAMGASSAVDAIEGLVPILGRPAAGSALWQLADGWKRRLGESTATEARYLQVALLEWEGRHNQHPDLTSLVELHVTEGQGTTLLTGPQVNSLWGMLDALNLRGEVRVHVAEHGLSGHLPGGPLRLAVGGRPVDVPADRRAGLRAVEPAPITYLFIAILVLLGRFPSLGASPWRVVIAGVGLCLGAGWWSHRQLARRGAAARPTVFAGAVVVAVVLTVLLTSTLRHHVSPDGDPIYAFGGEVLLLAFIGGVYREALGRREWAVLAAIVVVNAVGAALTRAPTARSFVASFVWNLTPYIPCRRVSTAMPEAAEEYLRAAQQEDFEAARGAFCSGQESVVVLVRQAHQEALEQLTRLGPSLEPTLAEVARARLEEVKRRLGTIVAAPAPSPPTASGWTSVDRESKRG